MRRWPFLLALLWLCAWVHGTAPPPPTIAWTSLAAGFVNSTAAGSGTYGGTAPSSISAAMWGGACSGSSTVTGFSAGSGTWSATFSTPSSAGSGCTIAITDNRGATGTSSGVTISAVTTNAAYPLAQANYATNSGCATNRYVNASTGNDTWDGTSKTFVSGATGPWATITHAESTFTGTHAASCINVAAGTYAGEFITNCVGNSNAYTGFCALRCAADENTATARPSLYDQTNGAQGSLPTCKITNTSHNTIDLGGVIATSNGNASPKNYVIIDGFEITDLTTIDSTIGNLSYNSGTGNVTATINGLAVTAFSYVTATGVATWTFGSDPRSIVVATTGFCMSGLVGTGSITTANACFTAASASATQITANVGSGLGAITYTSGGTLTPPIVPGMCFSIAGVTGSGSFAAINATQCAGAGSLGTTVIFPIASGLTLTATGGTLTSPDPHGSGSSVGSAGIAQGSTNGSNVTGAHHLVVINNYVHGMGGAGIQTQSSDYIYISGNLAVSNAWTNPFEESGIDITYNPSTVEPTFTAGALDGQNGGFGVSPNNVTIHDVIASNISRNNGNPTGGTDGNGIIIDTNNFTTTSCAVTGITWGQLLYGNVVANNAGRGVNLFHSSNIISLNNTAYNNAISVLNGSAPLAAGYNVNCGSNNWFKNNIGVAVVGSGQQVNVHPVFSSWLNPTMGSTGIWTNNLLNTVGSQTGGCGAQDTQGNAYACWNGRDQVFNAGLTLTQTGGGYSIAVWNSGTTYSGTANDTTPAVTKGGNTFSGVSGASNLNHDPAADAPSPGQVGTWWQNNGPNNNTFSDPLFTRAGGYQPNYILQGTSPGVGASGADATGLGGYTVATPNIGAF